MGRPPRGSHRHAMRVGERLRGGQILGAGVKSGIKRCRNARFKPFIRGHNGDGAYYSKRKCSPLIKAESTMKLLLHKKVEPFTLRSDLTIKSHGSLPGSYSFLL